MVDKAKKENRRNQVASMTSWIAEFVVPFNYANFFTESLENSGHDLKCSKLSKATTDHVVRVYFKQKPDHAAIQKRVTSLCESIRLQSVEVKLSAIEYRNWIEEPVEAFRAIEAGKFHICNRFGEPSMRLIDIRINPGPAFGTGHHETTYLCLEALSFLHDEKRLFENILDVGCGSGILAIASGKLWPASTITCIDNNETAITATRGNAQNNQVRLDSFVSEGFLRIKPQKCDLILANIFIDQLLEMAEDIQLFASDRIILSGFDITQTEEVIEKYAELGFVSGRVFTENDWVSLLLERPSC